MKYIVHVTASGGFAKCFEAESNSDALEKANALVTETYGKMWSSVSIEIKNIDEKMEAEK